MEIIKYDAEYANEVMETIPNGYIDKTVCGCGISSVALENSEDVIIAVPKIELSKNKRDQYPNSRSGNKILAVYGETTQKEISEYLEKIKPLKIMVTFNSLHRVENLLSTCKLIIDESDQILDITTLNPQEADMFFDICERHKDKISFVSATPIPLEYLPSWISDLPQIKIEWTETIKVFPITLERTYPYKALKEEILSPIIKNKSVTIGGKTFSKAIIFINSIDQIVKSIKESGINKTDCRIVCGDSLKNDIKISGIKRYTPIEGFPKFLFITKSGFNGIDVHSEDAITIVVSNYSKKWQMINVLTDLKQAISRQRIKSNPFYGTYIYIYNQCAFKKTEEELISDLDYTYKNLQRGVACWSWGKENDQEWIGWENDPDFKRYTIKKDGKYFINENLFKADKFFILETRKQYTKGFDIKGSIEEGVVEIKKPQEVTSTNYGMLVDYFKVNHKDGIINWDKIGGKQEWKDLIVKTYSLYGVVWKNYTYAKKMVNNHGDTSKVIEIEIKNLFNKNKQYEIEEIKIKLNTLYKKYNVDRQAKVTDLNDIIDYKQTRIDNKRFIKIL